MSLLEEINFIGGNFPVVARAPHLFHQVSPTEFRFKNHPNVSIQYQAGLGWDYVVKGEVSSAQQEEFCWDYTNCPKPQLLLHAYGNGVADVVGTQLILTITTPDGKHKWVGNEDIGYAYCWGDVP